MPRGIAKSGKRQAIVSRATLKLGAVIGNFTILAHNTTQQKYECRCICGKIVNICTSALTRRQRSCGCLTKQTRANRVIETGFLSLRKDLFHRCKKAAEKRSYEFNLSFEEFCKISLQNCKYCNLIPQPCKIKFSKGIDYSVYKHNGIDRMDNTIGYTMDNCVACCKTCNIAKGSMSLDDWRSWLSRVSTHYL